MMDGNPNPLFSVLTGLVLFSGISFIFFGVSCLFAPYMVMEFERYGLKKFRIPNGFLQIFGGIGLLVGLYHTPLLLAASSGLALLMAAGFGVRLRIKDGFIKSFPAFFYFLLNLVIFVWALSSNQ
ncbi:DoxX family protein [Pelagihabitans pacificus]|nr:DoxX family protein [Pelagihabitans pacificus]